MPKLLMALLILSLADKVFINCNEMLRKQYVYVYIGEFTFQMTFTTANGTGTGEMAIFIDTVDGIPYKDTEIICYSPDTYGVEWTVNAKPDPACKQPSSEKWLLGTYKVTLG